jgi:hypothetical protein
MPTGKRMKRRKNIVDYESLDLQTGRLLRGYSFVNLMDIYLSCLLQFVFFFIQDSTDHKDPRKQEI